MLREIFKKHLLPDKGNHRYLIFISNFCNFFAELFKKTNNFFFEIMSIIIKYKYTFLVVEF